MGKLDKIKLWVFIILRLSLVIAGVIAFFEENWTYLGISIITLLVMMLPSIIERRLNVDIPDEFEIVVVLFIYGAIFLGEATHFYDRFWWWDKMLHTMSGFILGNIGFLIISYMNRSSRLQVNLSPGFVAFFAFCFAVSGEAIWEIYEYLMDKFFGFYMQRQSLDDTMIDIILDTLGAGIFVLLAYFQQRWNLNIIPKHIRELGKREN